jgi:ankyrin repeat protein
VSAKVKGVDPNVADEEGNTPLITALNVESGFITE